MSEHQKYIGVFSDPSRIREGPMQIFNCKSEREARGMVEEFFNSHPETDEIALYELKTIGIRHASIVWTDEEFQLKASNGGRHYQQWTTDEDTYLAGALKAEIPYANIAVALGRTTHAVEVQASRLRCG